MASEKDFELLDQYVGNRLTPQDKAAFEQKLASDSALKSELKIQQRVVDGIRGARVAELKTMFNNIPVSAVETGGSSVAAKVALWIGAAAVTGAGIYFYLQPDPSIDNQSAVTQEEITPSDLPQAVTPQQEEVNREDEVQPQNNPAEENKASEKVLPPAESDQAKANAAQPSDEHSKTDEAPNSRAPLDVFDPTEENKGNHPAAPEVKTDESTSLNKSSIVVEIDNNNKKYNFHYQFKGGKLLLYGTFEKNLYEIMEFFSGNKRTVFLYYKDSYYLLSEENETIKPLAPINDPTLLKKLKDYRGAR